MQLIAHVDVDTVRANRVRRDQASFEQTVRVLLHDGSIFEGTRLALVGIHDQVVRLVGNLRHEAHLQAAVETRTTAASDVGFLDLLDHGLGLHVERLARRKIAPYPLVGGQPPAFGLAIVLGQVVGSLEHRGIRPIGRAG